MHEPVGLRDLGPSGRAAWASAVRAAFDSVLPAGGDSHPFLLLAPDERTPRRTGPEWTGLPTRVASCLGRQTALAVLDDERELQEEYVEWRVVRGEDRKIRRVEVTTELADWWKILASHEPEQTLELAGELVGRPVDDEELYGGPVPDRPQARGSAFEDAMIKTSSPLNDGREGILFMSQRSNNLKSLLKISAASASPCVLTDEVTGRSRCATAYETIPLLDQAAVAGRASDPVIVERLGRLAFEGRLIAPDEPISVAIDGVEQTRLRTPTEEEVPTEWFVATGGRRLVLEVPGENGFAVGDLVDAATERPIEHGGQIAELVRVRLSFRASEPGAVPTDTGLTYDPDRPRPDPCEDILDVFAAARLNR